MDIWQGARISCCTFSITRQTNATEQDSLGGNSKTVMIANISPSSRTINDTQSTLRFAQRAKKMGNRAHINEDASGDNAVLLKEIAALRLKVAEYERSKGVYVYMLVAQPCLHPPPLRVEMLT